MFTAVIDPTECIGCNKCVQACPFDAIIGAHKFLHTVLTNECIGCNKCVAPCPVDCITIHEHEIATIDKMQLAHTAKQRYRSRILRLSKQAQLALPDLITISEQQNKEYLQHQIQSAILRTKQKAQKQTQDDIIE